MITIALICVPMMLLPKPLILLFRHKYRDNHPTGDADDAYRPLEDEHIQIHDGKPEFEFGEEFIH